MTFPIKWHQYEHAQYRSIVVRPNLTVWASMCTATHPISSFLRKYNTKPNIEMYYDIVSLSRYQRMSVKPYTDYVCVHRYNYTAGAMSFVTKIVTNKTHLGSNLKRRPNLMEWSQLL